MLIRTESLTKTYHKGSAEIPVLRGVDFEIAAGEMVAITGASGVGKSTLLHALGTLEKPDSGSIFYGPTGQNILQLTEKGLSEFRNRVLGFIFQFHYLLPEFDAVENVMMPALISGEDRNVARRHAEELLAFVGLGHRLNHRPSELSGGEQQRVAIARSVILRPKLLLADELTGNLDSKNSQNVMDLLVNLNQATGISILIVTHDASIASRMHRVLTMRDGQFVNEPSTA
ncbi:MAG: ABC transporter ATP-binding protein [Cryobacterium sp.]|nr:ABC transporter ATP-binding protein [Oligoflexia bacterium]